jgi:hypothetical protein
LQENSCGIKVNNAQNNSTLPLWTNTHKLWGNILFPASQFKLTVLYWHAFNQ